MYGQYGRCSRVTSRVLGSEAALCKVDWEDSRRGLASRRDLNADVAVGRGEPGRDPFCANVRFWAKGLPGLEVVSLKAHSPTFRWHSGHITTESSSRDKGGEFDPVFHGNTTFPAFPSREPRVPGDTFLGEEARLPLELTRLWEENVDERLSAVVGSLGEMEGGGDGVATESSQPKRARMRAFSESLDGEPNGEVGEAAESKETVF